MNKGIQAACGEYCLFLNGGDYFYDNSSLDRFYKIKNKSDVMYGAEVVEMNDGYSKKNFLCPVGNIRDFLYKQTLPHQSTFFKKSLFEQYGSFDLDFEIIADREFYARVLVAGNASLGYIPEFISVFHFDGLSNKTKYSQKYLEEVSRYRKKNFSKMYSLRLLLNTVFSKLLRRPV